MFQYLHDFIKSYVKKKKKKKRRQCTVAKKSIQSSIFASHYAAAESAARIVNFLSQMFIPSHRMLNSLFYIIINNLMHCASRIIRADAVPMSCSLKAEKLGVLHVCPTHMHIYSQILVHVHA